MISVHQPSASSCLKRLARCFALLALPVTALAQQNIGELFATDARVKGSVILAGSGTTVLSGSQISAGAQTATLKLERGGSVLVCPGTNLSVTASQSGRQLLFSLNTGNLELNYPIGAAADTLLTPDLQLLLPGPGRLHVAVRITPNGDACVQSLASNGMALVVSETMGDATYQVKPNEAVIFTGGHISGALPTRENCGCPAPPPTQVARATPPPTPAPESPKPQAAAPPPPEEHLQVDAPFVFHGDDSIPDLTENVASLKLTTDRPMSLEPQVLPPPGKQKSPPKAPTAQAATTAPAPEKRSFFGKIGAFFASIFH